MAQFPPDHVSAISIDNCSGAFANDGTLRGSFIFDFGVHSMDLITFLGGDVARVFAMGNETGHLAEIVDFLAAIRERRTTRSNIYES